MSRWALFFLLAPAACAAIFAAAEFIGWSLPPNYSTIGDKIDRLYYLLLAVTGVVFLLTQLSLAFLVDYYQQPSTGRPNSITGGKVASAAWLLAPLPVFIAIVAVHPMPTVVRVSLGVLLALGWIATMGLLLSGRRAREGNRAVYSHGNVLLECAWTVVPAAVIVFITVYQAPVWAELRYPRPMPDGVVPVRVVGRQFEWRMVYPGRDGRLDTPDDLHVPNELHVVKGEEVWIDLRAMDVIHSFCLPMHRIKQDAVPGLSIPVWFDCRASTWDFQSEDPWFRDRDVTDLEGLVDAVGEAKSPLLEAVKSAYGDKFPARAGSPLPARRDVVAALNAALDRADLWKAVSTGGDAIPSEVRRLAESNPTGERLRLLNRKLLDWRLAPYIRPLDRHFDVVCTELCGWGHYRMKGRLVVHDTRDDWQNWLNEETARQEAVR
jgi:heme/copper-type cytochrome/quinol oxidase subunit 2